VPGDFSNSTSTQAPEHVRSRPLASARRRSRPHESSDNSRPILRDTSDAVIDGARFPPAGDLAGETPIFISGAAKLLPPGRRGLPVHTSTLLRWILRGVRTPRGVVRLDGMKLGGRWMTSAEALRRFTDQITRARYSRDDSKTPLTRSRGDTDRVEDELRRLGL
jgi:hypothetical protein